MMTRTAWFDKPFNPAGWGWKALGKMDDRVSAVFISKHAAQYASLSIPEAKSLGLIDELGDFLAD